MHSYLSVSSHQYKLESCTTPLSKLCHKPGERYLLNQHPRIKQKRTRLWQLLNTLDSLAEGKKRRYLQCNLLYTILFILHNTPVCHSVRSSKQQYALIFACKCNQKTNFHQFFFLWTYHYNRSLSCFIVIFLILSPNVITFVHHL